MTYLSGPGGLSRFNTSHGYPRDAIKLVGLPKIYKVYGHD